MKKIKLILILIIIGIVGIITTKFCIEKHITVNAAQYKTTHASIEQESNTNIDKIHFLKLMNSDAILIESNGHYGLVDVSNPSNADYWNDYAYDFKVEEANGQNVATYLNKVGVEYLDFIIGTHSHSDHIGGILDICKAGEYLNNDMGEPVDFVNENTTYIYKTYQLDSDVEVGWYNKEYYELAIKSMSDEGAKILEVQNHTSENLKQISQDAKFVDNEENVNDYIEFTFQNYNVKIFNLYTVTTRSENTNSLVVLVTKGEKKALLMADMDVHERTEQKIAENIGEVDLVKLGHHGNDRIYKYRIISKNKSKDCNCDNKGVEPKS